jgi:CDP-diacylglycerol--serine O-phosphatidyltransferase
MPPSRTEEDPARGPGRNPPRAAYALPTLFTAGNVFLGYVSVLQSFQGALATAADPAAAHDHFELAAKTIGAAVFLDGLDGRIARLTRTTSDFGREIDSLADVISFGIAPAVLAFTWGIQFVDHSLAAELLYQIRHFGYFIAFLFLLCGAARLARFNVQRNPVPKNPGRPDRKYFVGLPIPAAAAAIAAVVYAADNQPIRFWPLAVVWLAFLALLSFLMISTWRYYSFKDISLLRPRTPLTIVLLGGLIYLIWNYSQPVFLAMALAYVGSGVVIRIGGIVKRRLKHSPPRQPEHQVG